MGDNKWLRNSFVYFIIFVAVIALWFTIVNPASSENRRRSMTSSPVRKAATSSASSRPRAATA